MGATLRDAAARRVIVAAIAEALDIAAACGQPVPVFDHFDADVLRSGSASEQDALLDGLAARADAQVKQRTGIWRDIAVRHRPTEVPWLTGDLVQRGEAAGCHAPVNAAMVAMIAELDAGRRALGEHNLRQLDAMRRDELEARVRA
jgi:2-dehydropantoate 2-reductase